MSKTGGSEGEIAEKREKIKGAISSYKKEMTEKLRQIDPNLVLQLRFSINKEEDTEKYRKAAGAEEGWGDLTWNGSWSDYKLNGGFGEGFIERVDKTKQK